MNVRSVRASRYVTPLREGGSLPALIEADDGGMYVLKFRGSGQGPKALIAELVAGEMARSVGLPIPKIVLVDLDPDLARTEPDPEIQDLIKASAGLNLALEYLPGSVMFDPVSDKPDSNLASAIVWFDAFTTNVDRTARNTNMLIWQGKLFLIDHGAALYFHHLPSARYSERSQDSFALISKHVLLPFANSLEDVDKALSEKLTSETVEAALSQVPDSWLLSDSPQELRDLYKDYFLRRLASPRPFLKEAIRARTSIL